MVKKIIVSKEDINLMVELRRDSKTISEISKEVDYSEYKIWETLSRLNIKYKKKAFQRKDVKKMHEMYKKGDNLSKVGEAFGCTGSNVSLLLKKHGFKLSRIYNKKYQINEKFFEEIKIGNEYNPKFLYPSKNPLYSYFSMKPTFETYKRELKELRFHQMVQIK